MKEIPIFADETLKYSKEIEVQARPGQSIYDSKDEES